MNNVEFEVDVRDVEYQRLEGKAWLARIYQPKGTGPFPTIIDVHGGAWHNGDRTNNAGIDLGRESRGWVAQGACFAVQRNRRCRSVRQLQRRPSGRAQCASPAACSL